MRVSRWSWLLPMLWGAIMLQGSGCTQGGPGGETPSGPASTGASTSSSGGAQLHVAMVTDKGGLGDQSFNDSADHGLVQAKNELGIDPTVVQSKEEADYKKNLTTCAQGKFDLVIAVGILMTDAVKEVAAQHPTTKFALVDGDVEGMSNVTCLTFKEEEGSFLAGALAGLMTKSNKVAFMGGIAIPLILKFDCGYQAGVETTNPKAQFLEGFTGKWDDPGKGKEMADSQYGQGADIIFAAAGACNKGVIEAAKDKGNGFWAIGVDSDEDFLGTADPKNPAPPGRCLTSMVKHVDKAVYLCIEDLEAGQFKPGKIVYGLKEDGVGLTDMKYTKDQVPPDVLGKVDALKAQIIKGDFTVPSTKDELKAFKPPAAPAAAAPASGSPEASGSSAAPH